MRKRYLVMRKRCRVYLLACAAAACIVPVAFALSVEFDPLGVSSSSWAGSSALSSRPAAPTATVHATARTSPAVLLRREPRVVPGRHTIPDAVRLLVLGTVLLGLAAGMRRSL